MHERSTKLRKILALVVGPGREVMKIRSNGIEFDWYRNPIRLELVREVIPLVIFCCAVAGFLGYLWAMKAFH